MAKKKRALSTKKAAQILEDKNIGGKPLTEKQRKMFRAVASGQPQKRRRS